MTLIPFATVWVIGETADDTTVDKQFLFTIPFENPEFISPNGVVCKKKKSLPVADTNRCTLFSLGCPTFVLNLHNMRSFPFNS